MSHLFRSSHRRTDYVQSLQYLRPIEIDTVGGVRGVRNLTTSRLQAGTVNISPTGIVTGVRTLSASGTIETQGDFRMREFNSTGRIQSEGPIVVLSKGYYGYHAVGSEDADYGGQAPYYLLTYPTILPGTYPQTTRLWAAANENEPHLLITQGTMTYYFLFSVNVYTPEDLLDAFEEQNTGPLVLEYNAAADVFTLSVDDAAGALIEPGAPSPNYRQEFQLGVSSRLLGLMGFIRRTEALSGDITTSLTSTNRILPSSQPTAFVQSLGAAQGFYQGGRNQDLSFSLWSPVSQTWTGPGSSQYASVEFYKTMSSARRTAALGNEQVRFDVLTPDSLVEAVASVRSPIFRVNSNTNGSIVTQTRSEPALTRNSVLTYMNVTDEGHIVLTGCDAEPDKRTTLTPSERTLLVGHQPHRANLVIRIRDVKHSDGGPSMAFQGSCDNTQVTEETECVYAEIKAVPAPFTEGQRDRLPGGQLVFMTGSQETNLSYTSRNPREAMRINHEQQVHVGYHEDSADISEHTLKPLLYVEGNAIVQGTMQAASLAVTGSVSFMPSGCIQMYAGTTPPVGFLLCDGAQYSTTTYASLFSVIGYLYGGSGAVFNVPNMNGRSPIGAGQGAGLTQRQLAGTGGSETHTLAVSEMPSHNHGGNTGGMSQNESHHHDVRFDDNNFGAFAMAFESGDAVGGNGTFRTESTNTAHTHSIPSQGGNSPHNNMPPWIAMNFIIKV